MRETIGYEDLMILTGFKKAVHKLDFYLFHLHEVLETVLESYTISKELNVEGDEYVLIQELGSLILKVGFFWKVGDVYFGVKVVLPREEGEKFLVVKNSLSNKEWGFSRCNSSIELVKLFRLADETYCFEGVDGQNEVLFAHFNKCIKEAKHYIDQMILSGKG